MPKRFCSLARRGGPVLSLGLSHLPQRHSGGAFPGPFRPLLRPCGAYTVHVFWDLLRIRSHFELLYRRFGIPANHGHWITHYGRGRALIPSGRADWPIRVLPGRNWSHRGRRHSSAGGGGTVCRFSRTSGECPEPIQFGSRFQLPRHHGRATVWQLVHPPNANGFLDLTGRGRVFHWASHAGSECCSRTLSVLGNCANSPGHCCNVFRPSPDADSPRSACERNHREKSLSAQASHLWRDNSLSLCWRRSLAPTC